MIQAANAIPVWFVLAKSLPGGIYEGKKGFLQPFISLVFLGSPLLIFPGGQIVDVRVGKVSSFSQLLEPAL